MPKTEFHVNKITYNPFIKNWIMCVRYRTNILWWYQICTRNGRIIGKERKAKCRYYAGGECGAKENDKKFKKIIPSLFE